MSKKTVLAKNLINAIAANEGRVSHASGIAKKKGMSKTTTTALIKDPESRNPTLKNLEKMADGAKVELWMLFVEDFPFEVVGASPLKKISADGYLLLKTFEGATDDRIRYAMLEAVKQAVSVYSDNSSNLLAEAQSRYIKHG